MRTFLREIVYIGVNFVDRYNCCKNEAMTSPTLYE